MKKIEKYKDYDNIYIMTNENSSFFSKLKNKYNNKLYFYNNFDNLIKIKNEDNYYLFCIEKEIMNNAFIKISTFKNDNYDNYLSKIP